MLTRKFFAVGFLLVVLALQAWAKPWVVAHRGGTSLGPENRLVTFKKALELGVDALELDIHQSEDGHLMVIHDRSLQRTFQVERFVDQMTLEELKAIGVPTLQEVIDLARRRCHLVIEIKQPKDGGRHLRIEERLATLLRENDIVEKTVVISFDRESLMRLHVLEPTLQLGFLYASPTFALAEAKAEMGLSYIGPYYKFVTPKLVKNAHRLGLKVNPWTVNHRAVMKRLESYGVDAITTNQPLELKELIANP